MEVNDEPVKKAAPKPRPKAKVAARKSAERKVVSPLAERVVQDSKGNEADEEEGDEDVLPVKSAKKKRYV